MQIKVQVIIPKRGEYDTIKIDSFMNIAKTIRDHMIVL